MERKITPTPADVARCAPAILTAMLSEPITPTPTMYATLVAGRVSYCYPEVLTTTSYDDVGGWVAGEGVRNHPDTTWVVRTVALSVDVGTHVVYVDGRGDVLTMHASVVNTTDMVRYYAAGMAGDLGSTLDTCHTAYDVVAAVCNHLVATGNDPFYIDGEFVALMMYTGDYHSPLTNQDLESYANMWYKSLTTDDTDDDTIERCRGCGFEIVFPVSYVYDDDWYCGLCYTDMVARGE